MWNKFFWIWKIRMGYRHVLVLYVCVVLFIFDRDKLDVWPSEWHETLESLVRHLPRMVTDIIFMAPCIRGLVIITILVSYNENIYKIQTDSDVYPDFIDEDPDLFLLESADLLQPLLLELIWLEDLDIGHRGPQDPALVVLDVLGQLVIPEIDRFNF